MLEAMADIFSFSVNGSVSRICQWLPNSRTQRKKKKERPRGKEGHAKPDDSFVSSCPSR